MSEEMHKELWLILVRREIHKIQRLDSSTTTPTFRFAISKNFGKSQKEL